MPLSTVQAVLILALAVVAAFLFGRFKRAPRVEQPDRDALTQDAAHWNKLEDIYRALLERVMEMDQEQARLDKEIKRLGAAVMLLEESRPRQSRTQ
jgi:hypothetical protein